MNLGDLRALYRQRAKDEIAPYLWSDSEITAYLNQAVNEACIRAKLIRDSTSAITSLVITADTTTPTIYNVDPSIIEIHRVKLASQQQPLRRSDAETLDNGVPAGWVDVVPPVGPAIAQNWETQVGNPALWLEENSTLRLVPSSSRADTAHLTVYRLPLVPMAAKTDVPEIHAKYHFQLVDWALHLGYLKQDAETVDKVKAEEYEAIFIGNFGARPDANVQRKRRERHVTACRVIF